MLRIPVSFWSSACSFSSLLFVRMVLCYVGTLIFLWLAIYNIQATPLLLSSRIDAAATARGSDSRLILLGVGLMRGWGRKQRLEEGPAACNHAGCLPVVWCLIVQMQMRGNEKRPPSQPVGHARTHATQRTMSGGGSARRRPPRG